MSKNSYSAKSTTSQPIPECAFSQTNDPTVISKKVKLMFAKYGARIEGLIGRGKYGAVFNVHFEDDFDSNRFTEQFKEDKCITKVNANGFKAFAVKFVDIPVREQLDVEDIGEAVEREVNVLKTVSFEGITEVYFIVRLSDGRQYLCF
jgi:hypothetical protein